MFNFKISHRQNNDTAIQYICQYSLSAQLMSNTHSLSLYTQVKYPYILHYIHKQLNVPSHHTILPLQYTNGMLHQSWLLHLTCTSHYKDNEQRKRNQISPFQSNCPVDNGHLRVGVKYSFDESGLKITHWATGKNKYMEAVYSERKQNVSM